MYSRESLGSSSNGGDWSRSWPWCRLRPWCWSSCKCHNGGRQRDGAGGRWGWRGAGGRSGSGGQLWRGGEWVRPPQPPRTRAGPPLMGPRRLAPLRAALRVQALRATARPARSPPQPSRLGSRPHLRPHSHLHQREPSVFSSLQPPLHPGRPRVPRPVPGPETPEGGSLPSLAECTRKPVGQS